VATSGFFDGVTRGFSDIVADIRNKVVEEPWYGHATTAGASEHTAAAADELAGAQDPMASLNANGPIRDIANTFRVRPAARDVRTCGAD